MLFLIEKGLFSKEAHRLLKGMLSWVQALQAAYHMRVAGEPHVTLLPLFAHDVSWSLSVDILTIS